jgi:hypothetical protein
MYHVVGAGTDAGSLLLFDPLALPDDFDERRCCGFSLTRPRDLHDSGSAYWVNPHSDGHYTLRACVGEPIPASLRPFASDPVVVERFPVPSGRVYFTGLEYAFRENDAELRKHPHMGESFEIPPGVYRVTFYEMTYPEDLGEDQVRQQASPLAYRLEEWVGCMFWPALILLLAVVSGLLRDPGSPWAWYALPAAGLLVLLPLVLFRLKPFRQLREARDRLEREYPAFVAEFERQEAG